MDIREMVEAKARGAKEGARSQGYPRAFLDRLTLTEARIEEMAAGLRQVAGLPDPVGKTVEVWRRPNGMEIARVRVPLGVVGFIYESRPNVTADAAGLCLKAGNAVILRGGSEALDSNSMIAPVLAKSVEKAGLTPDAVQFIDTPDRDAVLALLGLDRYVDLIIPRGGEEFTRLVAERSTVPVLKHDKGLCHVFVDEGPAPQAPPPPGNPGGPPGRGPPACSPRWPRACSKPGWRSGGAPPRAPSSPRPVRRRR